ncbi:DUF885 family protein [Chitinophaga sp. sic0106]|uniref:DUF885 domain-containing protein n=1 Tax=Chitinophaga sp. sic0106 TaxID=2854785 RepID=UPI001C44A6BC|nr:DUF885 domain-containing protein [Chitinophaga sp. sic0106]MBV7532411.1 DUF885 domain-containing protein [Chitinophaga sp. sic0106]
MRIFKYKAGLIALAILCAASCKRAGREETAEKLKDIASRYYEENMALNPVQSTFNGEDKYNGDLAIDISDAWRLRADSFCVRYQQELAGIDTSVLSPNDRITYDMLSRELAITREGYTFHDNLMPVQQFTCLPLTLAQLGSGSAAQPFKSLKDYKNFIHRMQRFAVWTDTAIANMKRGIATGYVLPQALVVKTIPQMAALAQKDSSNIFFAPLKSIPDSIAGTERAQLVLDYTATVHEYIIPSYAKLQQFLETEYLSKARSTSGINGVPDGKAYYNYLIKYWTTTTKTPDEIFALGEQEVARIRGEMEQIKNSTGFQGDLPAFFEFVRNDKQFRIFQTPQAVLDSFKAIEQKIMPGVKKMYGHLPKTKFEIRQTEAFRAAAASAEYQPGSPDGTRPGVFYVPILDASKFSYVGMECLFLHEAIPGHHFQFSLQQENDSLPKFRRFAWIGSYGEGYALYCESLGKELGLYTNPYMYFGRLSDEIHRAIRLVVDVGLHTKGWTREQAIKYMLDNEPVSEQEVTAEIERYMAIPGQALSYKIGEIKIRDLRNKYTKELGNKFQLSAFHDELLKDGCVPLSVLDLKMERWASSF